MKVKANATSGGGPFSPLQARALGIVVATPFALAAAPAVIPAVRFTAGAATGLVPGMGEMIQGLQAIKWIRLNPATAAGVGAGSVVGLVNMYVHRENLSRFAKDKYDWVFSQIDQAFTPSIDFGGITSRGGRGATTPSQRTSKSVRPGKRRRRCKHIRFVRLPGKEYKRFDTQRCLRPRGHSGRHRFK